MRKLWLVFISFFILQSTFGEILIPAEAQRVAKGEAVGRLIKTGERDVALLGAIRLKRTKEQFLDYYRNLANMKKSPIVIEVGKFHNPPRPEDVANMTLDAAEVKDIRSCRPGKCSSKLNAQEMERYRTAMKWDGPDIEGQANRLARELMLKFVAGYMAKGSAALGTLNDKETPLPLIKVFTGLLKNFPHLSNRYPDLFTKIDASSQTEEFIYWSREKYGFGLKPLLNVTHVTIHHPEPSAILICSKQIRSSHYYDGSVGVTLLADALGGTDLIYINRSRIDLLSEGGWFRRMMIERNIPGSTRKEMLAIRSRVEQSK